MATSSSKQISVMMAIFTYFQLSAQYIYAIYDDTLCRCLAIKLQSLKYKLAGRIARPSKACQFCNSLCDSQRLLLMGYLSELII